MTSPTKHIRAALINLLSSATGMPFYDTIVPADITPKPLSYGIIHKQTLKRYNQDKTAYDWLCGVNIELYHIGNLGVNDSDTVDDMEEDVLSALDSRLNVNGFTVQEVNFIESETVNSQSDTNSINKKTMVYEIWTDRI